MKMLAVVALLAVLSLAMASCGGGKSGPQASPQEVAESAAVTREESASTISEPREAVTEASAPEQERTADPATLVPERQADVVGDMDALREAQAELERYRALWEANRAEEYSFVLAPICFCPQYLLDPVTIRVVDGVVASVTYVESGEVPEHDGFGRYVSIDEPFDTIQEAIDGEASQVTVSYDPTVGYPTDARLDYDANMADEEYVFTASDYLKR